MTPNDEFQRLTSAFKKEITPLIGAPYSLERIEHAGHIIRVYTGRLQSYDPALSQSAAKAIIKRVYDTIAQ